MAIVTEFYRTRVDDVNLYKSYSDSGVIIKKVGTDEEYDAAIDVEDSENVYEETDKSIDATEADYIKALEELGVSNEESNA
jgi:hypothetical protein